MARARNIKPALFKNEILGVADPIYTLLFEGLWLLADREGRLEDRPLRIKAEIFPYREGLNIDPLLTWLNENGFIVRYEVDGGKYIEICNFKKHQNPHKNEPDSEIPVKIDSYNVSSKIETKTDKLGSTPADSLNLIPDSLNLIPEDVTQIVNDSPKPKKSNRGSRLPDNFIMPDDWLRIGKGLRPELHDTEIKLAADSFIDYWHSSTGAKACKADWLATWRNWIRSHRPLGNVRQFPDKKPAMQANTGQVNYREGLRIGPDGEYIF